MAYYHSKYGIGYKKKKRARTGRILFIILLLFIMGGAYAAYTLHQSIFAPNTWTPEGKKTSMYIPTNSSYEDLKSLLYTKGVIINRSTFEWLAERKKLPLSVKPGKYILASGMSNNDLINMLRAGLQSPTKVIINTVNTKEQLAGKIAAQLETDSTAIINLLNDSLRMAAINMDTANAIALFIPNTYEFFWNTNAEQLLNRMQSEYKKFWNNERSAKADSLGFSKNEIITIASIIEKETNKNDEKARIAGVYLNRLKSGWRLQADPTLKYAMRNFGLRRILTVHMDYESPYNTYKYTGLPPGPICLPSIKSINAVLDAEEHAYYFFCAKDDLSGYHNFAKNSAQHAINARNYHQALNRNKIYK